MSFLTKEFKQLIKLTYFLLLFSGIKLWAQTPFPSPADASPLPPQIILTQVTATLVDAPGNGDASPSTDNPGFTQQWLKVEFTYSVTPVAKSGFIDAADFKVWIEGRDLYDPESKDARGTVVAFPGTLKYVNIPKSREAYGVVYLNSATLNRYCTTTGPSDFSDRFQIYVEAYIGGKLNSSAYKNKNEPVPTWFQQVKAIPNLVYNQRQSPFLLTDVNRYPALVLPANP